jgi:tripartite-type tricarboxylate transporter receptor subunit TctC
MRDEPISTKRRHLLIGGLGAFAVSISARRAGAQAYPARPITFICPWPAGGTADTTMRALCGIASRNLGQPFVVENKTGAAGMLGTAALVNAKPDGYTIGQIPLSVTRFAQLGTVKFDPLKDITYICRTNGQTFGIATRTESPWKNIAELVAHAKANPGKVTYGTAGVAGQTHVGMEEFAMIAGIELNHIPYRGGADALQALLGGHVDLLPDSSSWAPHVLQGKLRLLATWGEERLPRFGSVPTLKELGYKVVMNAPNGVGAPRGLDPQVTQKLRDAFKQATLSDEFRKECEKLDMIVMYQDADEYRKFIQASYEHEAKLIEKLRLKEKMT